MDGARAITTKGKRQRQTRRIGNHVRTTTNDQRTTDNGQRMFTGLILHSATIDGLETLGDGARLRLRATFEEPFVRGESLAVNGVCLTVLPQDDGSLLTDVSNETLSKTTLGALTTGARVSVERALT